MRHTRASRHNRPMAIIAVLALVLAAAALSACDGTTENPGGPSGTGASATQGRQVPGAVRSDVLAALRSAGVQFDPAAVTVTYGLSTERATVTGVLQGRPGLGDIAPSATSGTVGYGSVDLTLVNGTWNITGSTQ